MRYELLGNFTSFLFLFIIRHDFPKVINSAYTASLNNSDEIKNLFRNADDFKNGPDPDFEGAHRNGSLMEVGEIDVKDLHHTYSTVKKMEQNLLNNTGNVFGSAGFVEKQNMPSVQINDSNSRIKSNFNSSFSKTLQDTKYPGTGSNLFLGVPEVFHVNGISTIKSRKGVNFNNVDNKIVPRKGVDDENEESFLSVYSCFQLSKNNCYNAEGTEDFKCSCCTEGNTLGEIFKQKALINCNKCKPMTNANQISVEGEVKCKNICCKSVFLYKNSLSINQQNFVNLRNHSKLKPTVTKVPYDVEVMTELLSSVKQTGFLPIVISLILLPLIGITMFFMWQKTKEYWEKRFYKRMDFLIDGMYND